MMDASMITFSIEECTNGMLLTSVSRCTNLAIISDCLILGTMEQATLVSVKP